jgi:murein DD-endopeptidase MepM/ murein hydrolase activator NlpD
LPRLWIDWPIGSPEERLAASGQRLPGLWQIDNPFLTRYRLGSGESLHTGLDLNLNSPHWNSDAGMPIYAPCDGIVAYSGSGGGTWGWLIVVAGQDDQGNVFYCRMAHVNHKQFKVPNKGDVVTMGQEIALVGNADGVYAGGADHLHFDVCYTALLGSHPNDWPGLNRAYLLANYADPVEVIKHQALPQVPKQEILAVTADGDGLRLRSGPGTNYTAITSFRAGTKLTLTETVTNGADVWRKVIAPKVGYSAEKYKGGIYLAPVPPPPPPQPKPVAYSRHSVHYMAGGNWDYWAAILRQRAAVGKPVPGMLICSMNWSGEPTPEMAIQAGALECIWRDYPGESRWAGWQDVQGSYQAGYDFVMHCRYPRETRQDVYPDHQ